MNDFAWLSSFHLERPLWLAAIAPALIVVILLWQKTFKADQWQQLISPNLLPHLLDGATTKANPITLVALFSAWCLAAFALAGPSWEKRPVAVEQQQDALVILLDLSPSMMSQDIKPSRLVRARLKVIDLLRERKDGQSALLAYANDAHIVAPLTDDRETIINLIPALHPDVMPSPGSQTEVAVEKALELLKNSGIESGRILLITDGVADDAQTKIISLMTANPMHQLSVLGVGTTEPTPIPSAKGGFVRDRNRNIVTTQLDRRALEKLASSTQGIYRTLGNDNSDVTALLAHRMQSTTTASVDREFDAWYDRGPWFALLLLPFILYAFRRGVLLCVLFAAPLLFTPEPAWALTADDILLNSEQQAKKLFDEEQFDAAAEQFSTPLWKGTAYYRAHQYEKAAAEYAKFDSASAHYNRGNALAFQGQLDAALSAYEKALQKNPLLEDAKNNHAIIKKLKEQMEQQEQQEQSDQEQSESEKNKDDSSEEPQKDDNQNDQSSSQDQEQQQNNADQSDSDSSSNNQNASDSDSQSQPDDNNSAQQQQQQQKNDMNKQAEQDASQLDAPDSQQEDSSAAQQQVEQAEPQDDNEARDPNAETQPAYYDNLSEEERQAMEQWLRRVPDDPSGLLRNKFQYEHAKKRHQMLNGNWPTSDLSEEERW